MEKFGADDLKRKVPFYILDGHHEGQPILQNINQCRQDGHFQGPSATADMDSDGARLLLKQQYEAVLVL